MFVAFKCFPFLFTRLCTLYRLHNIVWGNDTIGRHKDSNAGLMGEMRMWWPLRDECKSQCESNPDIVLTVFPIDAALSPAKETHGDPSHPYSATSKSKITFDSIQARVFEINARLFLFRIGCPSNALNKFDFVTGRDAAHQPAIRATAHMLPRYRDYEKYRDQNDYTQLRYYYRHQPKHLRRKKKGDLPLSLLEAVSIPTTYEYNQSNILMLVEVFPIVRMDGDYRYIKWYLSTELLLAIRSIEGCKDARPARGLFVTWWLAILHTIVVAGMGHRLRQKKEKKDGKKRNKTKKKAFDLRGKSCRATSSSLPTNLTRTELELYGERITHGKNNTT